MTDDATPSDNSTPAGDAAPEAAGDEPELCTNCGAPLRGRYCAECGQKDESRIGPLRQLLAELFDELSLDARLVRTLRRLVRPGWLTRSYLDGRRASFVPPLRLFLIVSFVFLFLFALDTRVELWTDDGYTASRTNLRVGVGSDSLGVSVNQGRPGSSPVDSTTLSQIESQLDSLRRQSSWQAQLEAEVIRGSLQAMQNPDRLAETFAQRLSFLVFPLLPVFAALLKMLYRRTYYAAHLIFALHVHTFGLLVGGILLLGSLASHIGPGAPTGWMGAIAFLLSAAGVLTYTFLAMRRAYGESRARTAVKFVVLVAAYLATLLTGLIAYSMVVIALL